MIGLRKNAGREKGAEGGALGMFLCWSQREAGRTISAGGEVIKREGETFSQPGQHWQQLSLMGQGSRGGLERKSLSCGTSVFFSHSDILFHCSSDLGDGD